MTISEKRMEKDIENYIKSLNTLLKRYKGKNEVNLGKPNDKHLRTYIKNWYRIKLLFPETMDFNIILNRRKIKKFIEEFEKDKKKVAKKAAKKYNKTPRFVVVK